MEEKTNLVKRKIELKLLEEESSRCFNAGFEQGRESALRECLFVIDQCFDDKNLNQEAMSKNVEMHIKQLTVREDWKKSREL